jgi:hypothetical protein
MAGALTISTLNDSSGVLATQNGMTGIAKAWVNFNGTGTVAINSAFNVSSITDNGTGDYTVNFTTAMPNTTYATTVTAGMTASTVCIILGSVSLVAPTTTSRRFSLNSPAGAATDMAEVCVAVFSS